MSHAPGIIDPTILQPGGKPGRADALDALRGFAILTMALSGLIPFGVLPRWMYHAQVPPPDHVFDPTLAGFTWVDLVFPFFLFSMGAAIPLALSRRVARGDTWWRLLLDIGKRGCLLAAFAIYVQHIRPRVIVAEPSRWTWLIGLLAMVPLFLVLARLPDSWHRFTRWATRAIGLGGAILLLAWLRYPDGSGFSVHRSDIIIVVLANVAVFGSLIWLATRRNMLVRLGCLGLLLAVRLSHDSVGWVKQAWDYSPIPWIYTLYYLQYLFIVLPGTMVGDLLLDWTNRPAGERRTGGSWSGARYGGIVAVMIGQVVVLLVGLQARWLPWTSIMSVALCLAGWRLLAAPRNMTENLLRQLFIWGVYWLILGLVFESYEGGIKKDHPTLSYYFVTTGLAIFTLIMFAVVIDTVGKPWWLRLLIDNGRNPMIAYAGIQNLLPPVLALTGLEAVLGSLAATPWLGFVGGCVRTLLLAWAVVLFTRWRIYWRT